MRPCHNSTNGAATEAAINLNGEAEAFAHARAVTIIATAMAGDWKAAAWYLERKFQKCWGGTIAPM